MASEREARRPHPTCRVSTWAVTLALPVSQMGITMLVSVGNLEEAGEHVSFSLQIRRYQTREHQMWRCLGALHTKESSGIPALHTFLLPFFLCLSLGAREVLSRAKLWCGPLCVELALSETPEIPAVPPES